MEPLQIQKWHLDGEADDERHEKAEQHDAQVKNDLVERCVIERFAQVSEEQADQVQVDEVNDVGGASQHRETRAR